MSESMVESFERDASAHCAELTRKWAKEIIGTNCTFVDDDLRVLAHLADRAVKAGLTDGLPKSILPYLPTADAALSEPKGE